jgi:galactoside O-acetyltransferase
MSDLGGRYLDSDALRAAGVRHVGRGVRVHERASLYGLENISLGDFVRIDDFSVIVATGPVILGRYVSIPNFCFLGGRHGIELRDFVTLAPGVKIFSASDDYSGERLTGPVVPRELTGGTSGPVVLQKHVLVGAGSVILPACTIGEGSSVGALSLVRTDLPPWGVYAGVPVLRLRERRQDLLDLEARVTSVS